MTEWKILNQHIGGAIMQREADESLIFQAERVITGANSHRGRNLIHAYRNACYVGNEELINKARLELAEFIKQWRKYSPVADRREVARPVPG